MHSAINVQRAASHVKLNTYSKNKSVQAQIRQSLRISGDRLQDLFKQWDCDQSNTVSRKEFVNALKQLHIEGTPQDYDELFDAWDADGSGVMKYRELMSAIHSGKRYDVIDAFESGNQSGYTKEQHFVMPSRVTRQVGGIRQVGNVALGANRLAGFGLPFQTSPPTVEEQLGYDRIRPTASGRRSGAQAASLARTAADKAVATQKDVQQMVEADRAAKEARKRAAAEAEAAREAEEAARKAAFRAAVQEKAPLAAEVDRKKHVSLRTAGAAAHLTKGMTPAERQKIGLRTAGAAAVISGQTAGIKGAGITPSSARFRLRNIQGKMVWRVGKIVLGDSEGDQPRIEGEPLASFVVDKDMPEPEALATGLLPYKRTTAEEEYTGYDVLTPEVQLDAGIGVVGVIIDDVDGSETMLAYSTFTINDTKERFFTAEGSKDEVPDPNGFIGMIGYEGYAYP